MNKRAVLVFLSLFIIFLTSCNKQEEVPFYTPELTYSVNDDGTTCTITGFEHMYQNICIPGEIDGYEVVAIGDKAFQGTSVMQKIYISDGILEIGISAFEECPELYSVRLPNDLKKIGKRAFFWCNNLTDVEFKNNLESIEDAAFTYTAVKEINIPKHVKEIGVAAFSRCYKLKKVTILSKDINIREYAFDLSPLEMIYIEENPCVEEWAKNEEICHYNKKGEISEAVQASDLIQYIEASEQ